MGLFEISPAIFGFSFLAFAPARECIQVVGWDSGEKFHGLLDNDTSVDAMDLPRYVPGDPCTQYVDYRCKNLYSMYLLRQK
jgi:hypothetical protein